MKHLLYFIGIITSIATFILIISSVKFEWNIPIIIATFGFVLAIVVSFIMFIKQKEMAQIPLLSIFAISCLCTLIEIPHFFLITLSFFIGLIVYFSFITKNRTS